MSKKALLVGINHFIHPSWQLRGCINDTLEMQAMLTSYFGFTDDNIKILHDRDASKAGIQEGLNWLLSGYEGGGQDVRFFHFSSHGTQVDDQSGDEWECRDEVIVPHDHDWNDPFRDDDLRLIFENIDIVPKDVNFTFVADCCHSGTMLRLPPEIEFEPRYLTPPKAIREAIDSKLRKRDEEADAWAAAQLAQMLQGVPQDQWVEKMQEYLQLLRRRFRENVYGVIPTERHILLAGCEDRQTSADARIEGEWRGAFTWALAKAIKESNGDLTYDQLVTQAGTHLSDYEQRPQLECPSELRELKVFQPLAELHRELVLA